MTDPILVTGSHRSGSTWVGKVLSQSPELLMVDEPFHPRHRPGTCAAPVSHWYQYVTEDNQAGAGWREALEHTVALRFQLGAGLKGLTGIGDVGRLVRDHGRFTIARRRGARVLLKDPLAFFSAPWIAQTFHTRVVVLTRHPAAFASSLKRLDWTFDFRNWLDQTDLVADLLGPWLEDLERAAAQPGDVLEQAALCWRVIAGVTLRYQEQHPDWIFLRHEDLSRDPQVGFRKLCEQLDLPVHPAMEQYLQASTAGDNPSEAPTGRAHALHRDSKANISNWKRRLDAEEVDRIRRNVEPEASRFYAEQDW